MACGIAAGALGLGTGHLEAALLAPASSPVVAVAGAAIDLTPRPLKEWAIATLGSADKPVLVVGVLLVVLAVSALAGVLGARGRGGIWVFAVLGALAALATATRPDPTVRALVPAVLSALVAMAALTWSVGSRSGRGSAAPESGVAGSVVAGTSVPGTSGPALAPPDRSRRVLLGAAACTVAGGGLAYLGSRMGAGGLAGATAWALPAPTRPLAPLPTGLEVSTPGLSPLRTPVADFYRVDTAILLPRIDVDSWRLRIDGQVEQPIELTFAELLAMPMTEADIALNCVSNPVGGEYVGATRWLGVPTRDVLALAGVLPGTEQILSTSQDGMTISTPLAALQDQGDALLAIAMGGTALTRAHGAPVRMITPGLYGYVGATKWVTRLTATTYAAQRAYWSDRGWAERAPVKTQARIDRPRDESSFAVGEEVVLAGVAWSQARDGISRVQVRIGQGEWHDAELGPDVGGHYWRQWRWTWQVGLGRFEIAVRAWDGLGVPQTTQRAATAPDGASGLDTVSLIGR